jgi:hypothetical protein
MESELDFGHIFLAQTVDCFEDRRDFVVRNSLIHIDATDSGQPGIIRLSDQLLDSQRNLFRGLIHNLDRAEPDVEEGVRQVLWIWP